MQAFKGVLTDDSHVQLRGVVNEHQVARDNGTSVFAQAVLRPSLTLTVEDDSLARLTSAHDDNVVRPVNFGREVYQAEPPKRERGPEVAAALESVGRVADLIREAERAAGERARRATDVAFRALAQLEEVEAEMRSAQEAIQDLQEKLKAADARTDAADNRTADLRSENAVLSARLAEAHSEIELADGRALAAEGIALEAREDVELLARKIVEKFGLQPNVAG